MAQNQEEILCKESHHRQSAIRKISRPKGANIILDENGRTYHLGVKKGDINDKIILVGEASRAKKLSELLSEKETVGTTHRHFYTYNGCFEGVPVTIMSIGMGLAMMDFAIREIAQVSSGNLNIIRVGSCGTFNPKVNVGDVIVAKSSVLVQTSYNHEIGYAFSSRCSASPDLSQKIALYLSQGKVPFQVGLDITADEFYASQGRYDENFEDHNSNLVNNLMNEFPDFLSMQMETYKLFELARRIKNRKIDAASMAVVVAQRSKEAFVDMKLKDKRELEMGRAALFALLN